MSVAGASSGSRGLHYLMPVSHASGVCAIVTVGLIVPPGFQMMSFAPLSAFEIANTHLPEPFYEVRAVSEHGGPVPNSFGSMVATERLDDLRFDTLMMGARVDIAEVTPAFVNMLIDAYGRTRRFASVCLGAFALGEAGLLDGRRATTHWNFATHLKQRFPRAHVEMDRIFIADGSVWTSAGMSAGIDLALGLIEKDLGGEVARMTARTMVVHHRRAGGQSQHSVLLELQPKTDRIHKVLAYIRENLTKDLGIEALADVARLSPRQFTRLFSEETGRSPAKAVENLRIEAARLLIEQGRLPIETIAHETGFGDRERMRRAFLRVIGATPQAVRVGAGPVASM